MPLLRGGVWYWLDYRILSLTQREGKTWYTDLEISAIGDNIDGMGIQRLTELVSKHKEEQQIQEIVTIDEQNQFFFKTQGPDLEEWDPADDADVDDI